MAGSRAKAPAFVTPKGVFRFPKLSEPDFGTDDYPKAAGEYSVQLVLTLSDPATQALIAKLEPFYQAALGNAEAAFKALKAETRKKLGKVNANPLYTELLDEATEEPTGEIVFKFAEAASRESTKGKNAGKVWDNRPSIFGPRGDADTWFKGFMFRQRADGEAFEEVHKPTKPAIWGGSVGRVNFEIGMTGQDKDSQKPGYFIPGTGAAGLSLKLRAVQVIDLVEGGTRSASDYGFENEAGEPEQQSDGATFPSEDSGDF